MKIMYIHVTKNDPRIIVREEGLAVSQNITKGKRAGFTRECYEKLRINSTRKVAKVYSKADTH